MSFCYCNSPCGTAVARQLWLGNAGGNSWPCLQLQRLLQLEVDPPTHKALFSVTCWIYVNGHYSVRSSTLWSCCLAANRPSPSVLSFDDIQSENRVRRYTASPPFLSLRTAGRWTHRLKCQRDKTTLAVSDAMRLALTTADRPYTSTTKMQTTLAKKRLSY